MSEPKRKGVQTNARECGYVFNFPEMLRLVTEASHLSRVLARSSEAEKVLGVLSSYQEISIPKLAAKTKMSTEALDPIVQNLSQEGVAKLRIDDFGFEHLALKKSSKDISFVKAEGQ